MRNLYILKNRYFVTGDPTCDLCYKETLLGVHVIDWPESGRYSQQYCCTACAKQINRMNMGMQNQRAAMVCDVPPPFSIPFVPVHPGRANRSNMDVWQAATKNIGGERVVDKTKYANRNHALIAEEKPRVLIEEEQDPLKVLEFHKGGAE